MSRYWLFSLICFSIIVISLCEVKKQDVEPSLVIMDIWNKLNDTSHRTRAMLTNITRSNSGIYDIFDIFGSMTSYMTNTLKKYTKIWEPGIVSSMLGDMTQALNKTYGMGKAIGVDAIVEMFKQIIKKFNIVPDARKLIYESYEMGKTAMLCNGCAVFFGLSIFLLRDLVVGDETLSEAYITTCLMFMSRDFCEGMINLQTPIMFHLAKHKSMHQNQICAVWFQWLGCTGNVPQWHIELDDYVELDKPKGIYSGQTIKILQITDIHYDPLYKVGTVANCYRKSICCQEDSIVNFGDDKVLAGVWGDSRNCDVNMHFLKTTLKHITNTHNDLSYIYFTGDVVTHRIWDTTIMNNSHAIRRIHRVMKKYLPEVPIFSILGNHEPHPLNIFTPEEVDNADFKTTWLFKLYAGIVPPLIPGFNGDKNTILKGGFYSHLVRPGFRIIGINSNPGYLLNWWLVHNSVDPYGQLEWLKNTLRRAEFNNEAVHILSHVPCSDKFSFVVWCREFKRIVSRFSNTIMSIFHGHTHVDEMTVYHSEKNPQKPVAIAWNGGSLTPYDFNNPNYRIYEVDSESYEIVDYTDYFVDLRTANQNPNKLEWQKLYSFKEEYNMQNLTPYAMRDLVERMAKDIKLLRIYFKNRMKGAPLQKSCKKKCQQMVLCSFVSGDFHDDRQCKDILSRVEENTGIFG